MIQQVVFKIRRVRYYIKYFTDRLTLRGINHDKTKLETPEIELFAEYTDELSKMSRVVKKVIPDAPHEVWLVLDATTGQNGISQAKVFLEATDVTGIILTKMDGTAKGGVVLAIRDLLHLPVRFLGLGEKPEDLKPFDINAYLMGITKGLEE